MKQAIALAAIIITVYAFPVQGQAPIHGKAKTTTAKR